MKFVVFGCCCCESGLMSQQQSVVRLKVENNQYFNNTIEPIDWILCNSRWNG